MMALFSVTACSGAGASDSGSNQETTGSSSEEMAGQISVYSREEGSGTRSAFVELFEVEEKDANGKKLDMTTEAASITNSTSVMMTSLASDEQGIGYISLGSLNSSVKALKIDGAEPTADNVKNGDYKISRPFTIVTKEGLSDLAQDFIDFIVSSDGQEIIEKQGYVSVDSKAPAYQGSDLSGKIVIAGSSSVTPVMEKLQEAYLTLHPQVKIEVQQSDSTTGITMALEGTCDIGMASRELKDSEQSEGLSATVIAQDGIAVIVNTKASLDGLSSEEVRAIFSGEIHDWSDLS